MTNRYLVRYGRMRNLGEFAGLDGQEHPRGQRVVVRSDRGTEFGEVLCAATDRTATFLENPARGDILRVASPADLEREARLSEAQQAGYDACREFIARRRLQMDLVDVEPVFGGERMVFYYLSEKRVDFRELVERPGPRVADPHRDAPDRRPRRGQAPGRLRRLRQAGLLQHAPVADAPGVDADGQDPENDLRPLENLRPVW